MAAVTAYIHWPSPSVRVDEVVRSSTSRAISCAKRNQRPLTGMTIVCGGQTWEWSGTAWVLV